MTAVELELGERACAAIRAENYGLTRQRLDAIRARLPLSGWLHEYENGVPVRMRWVGFS